MGNGEAKELTCTTHGYELRGGNTGGRWGARQRGIKGRKKWDNYNSIINKTYSENKVSDSQFAQLWNVKVGLHRVCHPFRWQLYNSLSYVIVHLSVHGTEELSSTGRDSSNKI